MKPSSVTIAMSMCLKKNSARYKVEGWSKLDTIDRSICYGMLADKDLLDDDIQAGLAFTLGYYSTHARSYFVHKIDGTEIYSAFCNACKNDSTSFQGKEVQIASAGWKCIDCHTQSAPNLKGTKTTISNVRRTLKDRCTKTNKALDVLDGKYDIGTESASAIIYNFASTPKDFLTNERKTLVTTVRNIKSYLENRKTKNPSQANKFINKFETFYNKHPEFEETLLADLLKNGMKRMEGKKKNQLGKRLHNLYLMLHSISPKTAQIIAANMNGPSQRNLIKAAKVKLSSGGENVLPPIIVHDADNCVLLVLVPSFLRGLVLGYSSDATAEEEYKQLLSFPFHIICNEYKAKHPLGLD